MTILTKTTYVLAILAVLAMIMNIPNVSLAQNNQPAQAQAGQPSGQTPQPKGGVATVVGVDQPENCLRVRSGPGSSYEIIGCANLGDQLNITGVWTSNDWAQLADNGWVYGPQIQTDLRPPVAALSQSPSYSATEYPVYTEDYYVNDYYLPDYGYTSYWYGGVPLFLYDIGVWRRFHPWWRHNNHRVWNHGGNRTTNANVRPGTQRNFVPNRSNVSPSNVNRFNGANFRSGATNTIRSGRVFSNPGSVRTFSSPNRIRTGTSFGTRSFNRSSITSSGGMRIGGGSVRSFSGGQRSFGSARSFNTGSFGTARSFGGVARSFGGAARSGGGIHIGGGGGRRR